MHIRGTPLSSPSRDRPELQAGGPGATDTAQEHEGKRSNEAELRAGRRGTDVVLSFCLLYGPMVAVSGQQRKSLRPRPCAFRPRLPDGAHIALAGVRRAGYLPARKRPHAQRLGGQPDGSDCVQPGSAKPRSDFSEGARQRSGPVSLRLPMVVPAESSCAQTQHRRSPRRTLLPTRDYDLNSGSTPRLPDAAQGPPCNSGGRPQGRAHA